jgi:tRNA-dihydrouridine synthase B
VKRRREETGVAGVMIGRAAMSAPWIFNETKEYLRTGILAPPASPQRKWALIQRHCRQAVGCRLKGDELHTMQALRSRLMAYSKGMPGGKNLRQKFSAIESLAQLDEMEGEYFEWLQAREADAVCDPPTFAVA